MYRSIPLQPGRACESGPIGSGSTAAAIARGEGEIRSSNGEWAQRNCFNASYRAWKTLYVLHATTSNGESQKQSRSGVRHQAFLLYLPVALL